MTASRRALIILAALIAVALGLPFDTVPAASAQTIQVIAADPPSGEQGALNLNVLIKGKGFKNGAKAKFLRTGTTDPDGINVKATKYVSSTQLVATIDIADWATLSLFDIEVALADGRTGKGTELFSVIGKQVDPCTLPDPVPTTNAYTSGPPGVPGYLDSTFGSDGTGKVMGRRDMRPGSGYLGSKPLAADSLGRVVTVSGISSACQPPHASAWMIARYLGDGTPDVTFGAGGVVMLTFRGSAGAHGVLIQPDNKIVVVGFTPPPPRQKYSCSAVARFNEDGSLDAGFGSGGWTCMPGGGVLTSATLQTDGKIVVAGPLSSGAFVGRLDRNGTPDATFNGSGGLQMLGALNFHAVATHTVDGQERIVLAGWSRVRDLDGIVTDYATLWRFTSSGSLDDSFGTLLDPPTGRRSGTTKTLFAVSETHVSDEFQDLAFDSANRIVAVGDSWSDDNPVSQLALARYHPSGDLDSSFGNGGKVVTLSGQGSVTSRAVAIQPDGGIVVGGHSNDLDGVDSFAGVWRFTDGGLPDATFGNAGWLRDPITTGTTFVHLTGMILHGGKIVCVGDFGMQPDLGVPHAFLARLWQ